MRTLTIDEKEFAIAEEFNELTKEQFLNFVVNYYMQLPKFFWKNEEEEFEPISNDTYHALLYAQLINLLQIDLETFEKFTADDVVFLIDEMKIITFLTEDSNLTINHFPSLQIGKEKLISTGDDFGDLSAEEFLWAEKFYIEYKSTHDEQSLNALIACLYKDCNKKKEVLPFEVKRISVIEKKVAKIELFQKIAIMLFFEGCLNEIPQLYPDINRGRKSKDGTFKDVLLQVAKDGPFGDFDKVCKTNIHLVFSELNRVSKEAIEFENRNK